MIDREGKKKETMLWLTDNTHDNFIASPQTLSSYHAPTLPLNEPRALRLTLTIRLSLHLCRYIVLRVVQYILHITGDKRFPLNLYLAGS